VHGQFARNGSEISNKPFGCHSKRSE